MKPLHSTKIHLQMGDEFVTHIDGVDIYWDGENRMTVASTGTNREIYVSDGLEHLPEAVISYMKAYEALRS